MSILRQNADNLSNQYLPHLTKVTRGLVSSGQFFQRSIHKVSLKTSSTTVRRSLSASLILLLPIKFRSSWANDGLVGTNRLRIDNTVRDIPSVGCTLLLGVKPRPIIAFPFMLSMRIFENRIPFGSLLNYVHFALDLGAENDLPNRWNYNAQNK